MLGCEYFVGDGRGWNICELLRKWLRARKRSALFGMYSLGHAEFLLLILSWGATMKAGARWIFSSANKLAFQQWLPSLLKTSWVLWFSDHYSQYLGSQILITFRIHVPYSCTGTVRVLNFRTGPWCTQQIRDLNMSTLWTMKRLYHSHT